MIGVTDIEDALDGLLTAIEAQRDRRSAETDLWPVQASSYSAADLATTDPNARKIEGLIRDPIGRACREQIRVLGSVLFDVTGSTRGMRASLQRVAERCPEKAGRRTTIMDKWWDGLGAPGRDVWLA